MNSKYLIVISFDAVSSEDLKILSKMYNFSKFIKEGALIKEVESVYPSLTYPAHATISTGRYPKNHGIVNNTVLDIKSDNPDWYWYRKNIEGETVYDIAEENGLKTCSILWPVTARSNITYNMPEICCTKFYDNQIVKSLYAGTVSYQIIMNKRYGHLRRGIEEPYLDNFSMEVAKDTIKEKKPNLMLLHLVDVDSQKHLYGCQSKEVKEALERHDKRLGEIIESLKEAGIFEESTVIALGDHSQLDVKYIIRLNAVFLKEGLIRLNRLGKIKDYDAIAKSCDGSSYIYLKDRNNLNIKSQVYKILNELMKDTQNGIEKIIMGDDIDFLGADSKSSFIVEAKKYYYFIDEYKGRFLEEIKEDDIGNKKNRVRSAHGYLPIKEDYKTFFIANGNGIKSGVVLESGKLINHGPTIAKLLGLKLKNTDGEVEERILNI